MQATCHAHTKRHPHGTCWGTACMLACKQCAKQLVFSCFVSSFSLSWKRDDVPGPTKGKAKGLSDAHVRKDKGTSQRGVVLCCCYPWGKRNKKGRCCRAGITRDSCGPHRCFVSRPPLLFFRSSYTLGSWPPTWSFCVQCPRWWCWWSLSFASTLDSFVYHLFIFYSKLTRGGFYKQLLCTLGWFK